MFAINLPISESGFFTSYRSKPSHIELFVAGVVKMGLGPLIPVEPGKAPTRISDGAHITFSGIPLSFYQISVSVFYPFHI